MVVSRSWLGFTLGASLAFVGLPAQADVPGLYYSWRSLDGDVPQCLDRATAALRTQALTNIQVEGNSVAGTAENARAVFVCLENADATTVMIMVTSLDDDTAFQLREALKNLF